MAAQPPPRVLERAASKAADATALGHPGKGAVRVRVRARVSLGQGRGANPNPNPNPLTRPTHVNPNTLTLTLTCHACMPGAAGIARRGAREAAFSATSDLVRKAVSLQDRRRMIIS